MPSTHRALLRESRLFVGLSEQALADVLNTANVRCVPQGNCIARQGEPAVAFGMLVEGRAKNMHLSPEGHQSVIRYLKAGQEFGLVAVFDELEYPITIEAVSHCALLYWPGPVLIDLMERHHKIAVNALRVMITRNQDRQRRYEELANEKVEQRLARSLLRLGHHLGTPSSDGIIFDIPISREDLAEFIGTTLFSVSRVLSRWDHAGLVKSGREQITIVSPSGLEQVASPPD